MTIIISIERKLLNIKLNTYYFTSKECIPTSGIHLIGYLHSIIPRKSLRKFDTLQIDLTKEDSQLLMNMHKKTRKQIRMASEQVWEHVIIENPTDQDLKEFQSYYNRFAKDKNTHVCNGFHIKTMKLLREKNALLFTYLQNKQKEILCYRVYIMDHHMTMTLYSASHFRMENSGEDRRLLGQANRLLIWKCILWFKEKGFEIYDMGGITDDPNIRNFKLGFGGEIVPVYSGYEASSKIGDFVLKIRGMKMSIASRKVTK